MLPSAQAGGRPRLGFDPSDLHTFLGSGFVLLPLRFCLRRRPKKLANTQQQLQQTENISQSEEVGLVRRCVSRRSRGTDSHQTVPSSSGWPELG